MKDRVNQSPIITIDGPAGSGKGTVSEGVANTFGWHLLDSGALYRIVAYVAQQQGIDCADEAALQALIGHLDIAFYAENQQLKVIVDEQDISDCIRTEDCGAMASAVAKIPCVREALLERQRAFQQLPGLVADGRDMGTVVFPDAALKVYLTASPEVRAERRHKQLKQQGIDVSVRALIDEIAARDAQDMSRKTAPLKPADDAVIIDTDILTADQVIAQIVTMAREGIPSLENNE